MNPKCGLRVECVGNTVGTITLTSKYSSVVVLTYGILRLFIFSD